jgi:hypothetical protein
MITPFTTIASHNLMATLSVNFTRQLTISTATSAPKLKKKLASEKAKLKKIQKDLDAKTKKFTKSAKERKAALEKKELAAATKPHKAIHGYTFYFKTVGGNLKETSQKWNSLSQSEKETWHARAREYNEQIQQLYPPKPKAPASGYNKFLKEQYYNDGSTFGEISKQIAKKWNQLTAEEKSQYSSSQGEKDAYAEAVKKWTGDRLKTYQQQKAAKQ